MQFDKDLESKYKDLFLMARNLLIDEYRFVETKKERITTYSDANGGICHMRTMKHGIHFGFLKGARMEDRYDRLTGTGKVMRILSISQLDLDVAHYYIDQAVRINAEK